MILSAALVKEVYLKNQKYRRNTYLVPKDSFDGFLRDELLLVKYADMYMCTVNRYMDGNFYDLTDEQLEKFKCVGSC